MTLLKATQAQCPTRPALIVAIDGEVHPIAWTGPRPLDAPVSLVHRIREQTLADAARARKWLRAAVDDPENLVVALEVDVLIADDAAAARVKALQSGSESSDTVRYIGTPYGLLTLIEDIYTAEVADAVILRPLDGLATAVLIADQVLPALRSR